MVEEVVEIMGGEVYYFVEAKRNFDERKILDFLKRKVEEQVLVFDFYNENSLLSRLNREREVEFDEDLFFVLEKAYEFYLLSEGKFNVFCADEIVKRKSGRKSLRNLGEKLVREVFVKIEDRICLVDDEVKIDLGGIAKGYIIDRALEKTLEKFGKDVSDVLIDARGDIVTYGKNKKFILVENPFDEGCEFESFVLKSGAVITSGHNRQVFNGKSHIVGECCDILSVTLRSEKRKCYELDALGTYFSQLNSEVVLEMVEFCDDFVDIECLLVLRNGKVLKSSFWG